MIKILQRMSFSQVADIERRIFFYICGLSISLPLSKAVGNIFLLLSLIGLIHRLIRKHNDVSEILQANKKILTVIAILMAAIFVSALTSEFPLKGVARFLERYLYHAAAILPVLLIKFERKKIILFTELLLVGVFLSNLSVIVQALPNLSAQYWRFGGVIGLMPQASLLAMFVPVFVLLLMHFRFKILFTVALVVGLTATLLNGTRGAWLAILIMIPAIVLIYSRKRLKPLLIIIAGFFVISGIVFTTPPLANRFSSTGVSMDATLERFRMWQSAFNMFKDNPIFGVGYGSYADAYQTKYILPEAKERKQQHAHNNTIQFLAECGIVGAAAFILMWSYFTYFSLRGWFKYKNIAYLMFFCVLWGLMLHGLTEYNFETSTSSKIYWYSLGLCLAYRQL